MTRTVQVCRAMLVSGVLETVRRRDLYVVLILTVSMVLGAYSFSFFGVSGLKVFVKDMAFTCVGLFSTIVGVIIAGRQLPEEIQRRTIYPLLARPISRWQLLVGKFVSAWLTSCLCFLALTGIATVLLLLMRVPLTAIFFQYIVLKCFSFLWLCGFTIFLSVYMSQGAAVTVGLLLAMGSGAFTRAYLLFANAPSPLKPLFVVVYGLFPNYNLFDLTKKLVYDWPTIPLRDIVFLFFYGVLIGFFWLRIGWLRFRHQAL